MEGELRVELRNEITYVEMGCLSSSSSSAADRGKEEVSKGVNRWIVATCVNMRILPISGLDHPNVLSYIDVLRQDANVGHRVTIIGVRGVGFDTKRWVEDWGVEGTNEARAGSAATIPSQRQIG